MQAQDQKSAARNRQDSIPKIHHDSQVHSFQWNPQQEQIGRRDQVIGGGGGGGGSQTKRTSTPSGKGGGSGGNMSLLDAPVVRGGSQFLPFLPSIRKSVPTTQTQTQHTRLMSGGGGGGGGGSIAIPMDMATTSSAGGVRKNPPSGYRGVTRVGKKWKAEIGGGPDGKTYLGLYVTQEEAAKAYDQRAKEMYGKKAKHNFDPVTGQRNLYVKGKSVVRTENYQRSEYRGVHRRDHNKWRATGNKQSLGTFDTQEEAAKAYDEWALKTYGKNATLNFNPVTGIRNQHTKTKRKYTQLRQHQKKKGVAPPQKKRSDPEPSGKVLGVPVVLPFLPRMGTPTFMSGGVGEGFQPPPSHRMATAAVVKTGPMKQRQGGGGGGAPPPPSSAQRRQGQRQRITHVPYHSYTIDDFDFGQFQDQDGTPYAGIFDQQQQKQEEGGGGVSSTTSQSRRSKKPSGGGGKGK